MELFEIYKEHPSAYVLIDFNNWNNDESQQIFIDTSNKSLIFGSVQKNDRSKYITFHFTGWEGIEYKKKNNDFEEFLVRQTINTVFSSRVNVVYN